MNPIEQFNQEKKDRINSYANNNELNDASNQFNICSNSVRYSYNFTWMGRPIIQYPQDMIAMQEIIWELKPDVIIETGIAHGGSLIYYASLLELIGNGRVIGIDIDIRAHNRAEIERHPMIKRIEMIQGSSIDTDVVNQVKSKVSKSEKVLVVLDSNHTEAHVLNELNLYSPLVSLGSYLVVFDTIVEFLPANYFGAERPWGPGNNPMTAVNKFLELHSEFEIDHSIDNKLLISVAKSGYLRKIAII